MITHIRMKNFKSWKDSPKIELAPLTGFFGTNSSGKSSLLQMLLLLKQTVDSNELLFFGDEKSLVNLGSFREVIHGHKGEDLLELGFECKFPELITIRISQYGLKPDEVTFDSFNFETAIQTYGGSQTISHIYYNIGGSAGKKIKLEGNDIFYQNKRLFTGSYKNCYSIEETTNAFPGSNDFLNLLSSKFEKVFSHVYYFGPTRVHPKRYYHWEKIHPKEIDMWGNKVVDALLSARVRQLTTAYNGKRVSIEERISKWLQKLKLAHSLSLVSKGALDDNNYEIRLQKTSNSAEVTLADLGHGVSDLFPLLVHCCYVPEGSTLILEQPGVHLHPKAQADLADLLIEVITERNLQILIESHSEHLLTRIQRRVAEKQIRPDDVALHFCRNTDGISTIEQLEVDEFGEIKNWPENFFGDVMGDMFAMTDKQVEDMTQQKAED